MVLSNLKINVIRGFGRLNRFFNAYIYCAIFIILLFAYPIYSTQTPDGVTLIKSGSIALSTASSPSEISKATWSPISLPYGAQYTASGKLIEEWFSVELPAVNDGLGTQAILISNFPLSGIFFLGDKEIYRMAEKDGYEVARNDLPIYLTLQPADLEKSHTIYIKVKSIFSFADLEPIYFGDSQKLHELYKQYLNWNVKQQHTVVVISFIFMVFFILAWFKNLDVPFFKNMLFLSLFWLLWEKIVLIERLSISYWVVWRCVNWFCIAGLLYFFVVTGLLVVRIAVPRFLKYYFISYALIGSFMSWYDYEGTFLFTQLLILTLYIVLNYGASLIFKTGYAEKNWSVFSLGLVFVATSPGSVHDFLVWSGLLSKWAPFLSSIGVPQFFLQSNQLSYLVAIPYLLVTGFTLLKIIEDKERYKTQSAIATREERARIIRDLHDGLGAVLTMGSIQAQSGALTIEKAKMTITESLNDLRLILNGFNTEVPNMAAIVETIGEQAQRMFSGNKRMSISYQLPNVDEVEPKLSQSAAMNLAKITREALTNAAKYSGGSEVHVELKYLPSEVVVEVTDNGLTGFDFEACLVHPTGNGLKNMRSRAIASNGTFTYISEPGKTRMIASMPVVKMRYE